MGLIKWLKEGNDCANCPACWEENYYTDCGTEYDGGCYIYGDDFPEPCRLLLPKFIRGFIIRRTLYEPRKRLSVRWKELIVATVEIPIVYIKSYFCK